MTGIEARQLLEQAIEQFFGTEQTPAALRAELQVESKRREQLERRVNELVIEGKERKRLAAEAELSSAVRAELQRLGVSKIDIVYRVVKDWVERAEDGRFLGGYEAGERKPLTAFLDEFLRANPELRAKTMAATFSAAEAFAVMEIRASVGRAFARGDLTAICRWMGAMGFEVGPEADAAEIEHCVRRAGRRAGDDREFRELYMNGARLAGLL